MTRYLSTLLAAVPVLMLARAAEARQPIVAVFNVEVKGVKSVDDGAADRFADFVTARLASSGQFQVVPRSQVKARLFQDKSESYKECFEQSCQVELGRELAAEKTVSIQVLGMADTCTVNLVLYDLDRSTTEAASSDDGTCTERGVVDTLKSAVARLEANWIARPADASGSVQPSATAVRPASSGPVSAATVPPGLGLTDAQWGAMLKFVGVERSKDLANGYLATVGAGGANGDNVHTFNDYLDEQQAKWKKHRDGGMGTTIAFLTVAAAGLVVGGALYGAGGTTNDDPNASYSLPDLTRYSGTLTMSIVAPLGAFFAGVIGAPIWGVYQSRLDDLERARRVGAPPKTSLRWTGIAPLYDPFHGTKGVAASFTF